VGSDGDAEDMLVHSPTYFFMHVMKTGGTTFIQHIQANFPPEAVFPSPGKTLERRRGYFIVDELRRISRERRRSIRVYTGHFPFVAAQLVGADVTLAIVRDPISRTLSFLRDCKRHKAYMADMTLEEIYDDPWMYPVRIHNYQAKLFAMTLDDEPVSDLDVFDVDGPRLEVALAHLERVDVLGLQDRYAEFLETMRARYGWRIGDVPNMRVSTEEWEVPPHLPERIAADNAADMALYERARELCAARQGALELGTRS
jgi:hypothetical protein